jgi:hypothetical protein
MNESQPGAFGLELGAKFGELGDRLATKGSAKVTQKNNQKGLVRRERFDGVAELRAIGLKQLAIKLFREEHRPLHLCLFWPEEQTQRW